MRIVLMFEAFTKNMGYLGNMLPKYLARLGADVHVITTDLPYYHSLKDLKKTYGKFIDINKVTTGTVEKYDGYTLHVLPYKKVLGHVQIVGCWKKLREISPDIVQVYPAIGWVPLHAAMAKPFLDYKLFTGSHTAASTFPLAKRKKFILDKELVKNFLTRTINGRIVSLVTEKCYCPTEDCAEIAWRFNGVEKNKVEVVYLGVDTEYFYSINSHQLAQERSELREKLGFNDNDIVCIYTGKMTEVKNPVILAQAIEKLREMGENFSGLFIGNGIQKELLEKYQFCKVLDFMHFSKLANYYRASDIAVWPTNESTSMLDAAACGIPLIVSDGIVYRAHVEGNGLVYNLNNLDDLVRVLLSLGDSSKRYKLGINGAEKMLNNFSWEVIAKNRLKEYEIALSSTKSK